MKPWVRRPDGTVHVEIGYSYPGPSAEQPKRNPYDCSTWGAECARGFRTFKDAGGTHITGGRRKARGMSSDGLRGPA